MARDALRSMGLSDDKEGEVQSRPPPSRASSATSGESGGTCSAAPWSISASPAAALLLGALVSVPLGLWLERRRGWAEGVIRVLGLFQTVPSLALLAFMIPVLGVGRDSRHRGALDLLALPHGPQHLHRGEGRRSAGGRSGDRPRHDSRTGPPRDPPPFGRAHGDGRRPHRRRAHRGHRHPGRLHRRRRPGRAHRHRSPTRRFRP